MMMIVSYLNEFRNTWASLGPHWRDLV